MGFDDIIDNSLRNARGKPSLLGWLNSLDRHLDRFLSMTERGPRLKFIANFGDASTESKEKAEVVVPKQPQPNGPTYTAEQRAQAEKRRNLETRQLEARLGRMPTFQKSIADGVVIFTIPIQPAKLDRIPQALRSLKTARLFVPLLYPLETSSVELQGVDHQAAVPVESAFVQWVRENSSLNLMSQVNYLASNLHTFANTPPPKEAAPRPVVHPQNAQQHHPPARDDLDDRSHLHVIPRPPEWNTAAAESDQEDLTTSDSGASSAADDDEFSDEQDHATGLPVPAEIPEYQVGRGVALSFPSLEIYGIELLVLFSLCVTVKCDRCKEPLDITNVRQATSADVYTPKVESCKKCANSMSIGEYFNPFNFILNSNLSVVR